MSEVLQAVSKALVETVTAVEGGIVRVEGRQRLPASGIVWSDDGLIITAHHVVERNRDLRVGVPDGEVVPAELLGRDPGTDLAVLRAQARGLTPLPWADLAELAVGSLVLAVGRPGTRVLATLGVLSAVDDGWRTPAGGYVDAFVQSDTVMYPGFSGGALVDAGRRVAGLATSALAGGHSVALPLPTVRRVVEAALTGQSARPGYLGVTAQAVPLPAAVRERLGQETGLLVVQVEPGSPAERSRVVQGDTLVRLNGQPLRSLADLLRVLHSPANGQVPGTLVRAGQLRDLPVFIGQREG